MQHQGFKLPITAFVASCNEGHLLKNCLEGLSFCSEIYVINLSSNDNTKTIAITNNAKVLEFPKYPVVEIAHNRALKYANYEWVLLTDPDEIITKELQEEIIHIFNKRNLTDIAAIKVPVQFYFKKYALKGTIWGGENFFRLLYNKNLIETTETVHKGVIYDIKKTIHIEKKNKETVLKHYWMTSYSNLFEKHNRYIKKEGEKLYREGIKYSLVKQVLQTLRSFKNCYYYTKGYKDGFTGLFLSLFWSYYNFKCFSYLALFEKKIKSNNNFNGNS